MPQIDLSTVVRSERPAYTAPVEKKQTSKGGDATPVVSSRSPGKAGLLSGSCDPALCFDYIFGAQEATLLADRLRSVARLESPFF